MSRARLRRALETRAAGDPAVVPLVEAHAAKLEQLPEARWLADAEAHARMLRAVQGLYALDAVTIGGGGLLAAAACALAVSPSLGPLGAHAAARAGRALPARPDPAAVAGAAPIAAAKDVLGRLRPTLGERAGIAVVLADPGRLARQLGAPGDVGFAGEILGEIVRAIGPDEPDLFLLVGDDDVLDPAIESSAEFFGVALVACGPASPAGVAVLDPETLGPAPEGAWLCTTAAEIPAAADPQSLRAVIAALRSRPR